MKHIIVLFIVCTLFPLTIQAQMETVMDMHHDDDTLDVKYTKEMLQGKLWELEIPKGIEVEGYAYISFTNNSMRQIFIIENTKYDFPCIYYLSDSYQMDFDDKRDGTNQAGKYLQVQCRDAELDGTGELADYSYWIRKLTDDTLELVEWKSQKEIKRYHAKPIQEQ